MNGLITELRAREILDSRGMPTVEADVRLDNGIRGRAAVPSGASTGKYEAHEKRDGDKRYAGNGVRHVIDVIHHTIAPVLEGQDVHQQDHIDAMMIRLDGSKQKKNLGANAILAVSLACLQAAAADAGMPLYRYIGGRKACRLPVPLINVINGGCHANNTLAIQEFMLVPWGAESFSQALQWSAECLSEIKKILQEQGYSTAVGDEGGFAPQLKNSRHALDILAQAVENAGRRHDDIAFALDVAANELFSAKAYHIENMSYQAEELTEWYAQLAKTYPIISIEDPFNEDDIVGWQHINQKLGEKLQIVGDDLFVTNHERLQKGIEEKWANAILIKMNQIGSISETEHALKLARDKTVAQIISHRSGETEDTSIADIAVGYDCPQIKAGSLTRSERLAKYNQLLRIEEQLGEQAQYYGRQAFFQHHPS